ncbi:hypothetical protein CQA66_03115 [Helicobacter aurati]|uniref:Calcineurin-like phosphoesterase domain-containing protein n=1 Tax=Helicobacter aurati TaxID=137778 RepID=A0A3D8J5Z8_9HELI|nr:hypothetical protein [Helicobacter aurati]RDU72893.1 hypothetical protein CQA66_03115 [Helicobacter aurati]
MTFIEDIILQEDAIFIADSHFKQGNNKLKKFFLCIPKGIQVFLMGDIFHLLIGALQSSRLENHELICIISQLSLTNTIIFLEGNHDFSLQHIWRDTLDSPANTTHHIQYNPNNIRIYTYYMQPIILKNWKNNTCILAHGDLWINSFYNQYRKILNSNVSIFLFKVLDRLSCGIIYRNISRRVSQRITAEFSFYRSDFKEFMLKRIRQYQKHIIVPLTENNNVKHDDIFYIIEGHFHLGQSLHQDNIHYIALPSLYCTKTY